MGWDGGGGVEVWERWERWRMESSRTVCLRVTHHSAGGVSVVLLVCCLWSEVCERATMWHERTVVRA